MERRRATGVLAAAVILATSLLGAALPAAAAVPTSFVPAASGGVPSVLPPALPVAPAASSEPGDCVGGLPASARCATLVVPENRANPASRPIGLPYAVIPASTQPATGAPVLVMTADTAEGAAIASRLSGTESIGAAHEVVLLARRGGPDTTQPFLCPAAVESYIGTMTTTDTPADEMADVVTAMQTCVGDFAAAGGDVSGYDRLQTASDVVDLRTVLQYPTWMLLGTGPTTSVMQSAAVLDPGGVSGVVMDGFLGSDQDLKGRAYEALGTTLATLTERSGGEYGDLATLLLQAEDTVTEESANGIVTDPLSGRDRYYDLTASDVITLVQLALGDPAEAAAVPFVLQRVGSGETGALQPLADLAVRRLATAELPLTWLQQCRDWQPFWSADPTEAPAEGSDGDPSPLPSLTYFIAADKLCPSIGVPPVDPATRGVPASGAPALVFASDTDPTVAPAAAGAAALAAFPSAQVVTVQSNGAASSTTDPCALDRLSSWLAAPGTPVDPTCTDGTERFGVIAADDVHETVRVAPVIAAVDRLDPLALVVPLIFAAFAVLWGLGWVITLVVQAVRREPIGLLIASGIPPLTGIAFLVAVWVVMSGALAAAPGLPLVGVPPIVPGLGILLGVGFLAIIPVWRLRGRGAAVLAAAASLVWIAMMVWFVWIAVLPS